MKARSFLALMAIVLGLIAIPASAFAAPTDGPALIAPVAKAPRTPRPTKTPTPTPTATSTPVPTTPAPTSTSAPSPTATSTPVPTTPAPTSTSTPGATAAPTATATTAPATSGSPIYWGVNLSGVPWDMNTLENWEKTVATDPTTGAQKHVSIVNYGHFWGDSGSSTGYREFSWSVTPLNNIRAHGSIPMISWTPENGNFTWQLSDIIGGVHDAYITRFATGLRDWQGGAPIFLRMMHEMNGNWGYPWQEDYKLNTRGEFVQAWQHIVAIFRSVGANNASFVWCPNVEYAGSTWPTFDSLWPEDAQHPNEVDWACLDGYNKGDNGSWLTFDQVFHYAYNEIVNSTKINYFGPKPVMIGEWGSVDGSGKRAGWLTDALTTQLATYYPRMKAAVYYDFQDGSYDWRIEPVASSSAAWAKGINQPYYTSNTYGNLMTSPIAVP